jgi:regulator of sigma E protease
MDWNQVLYTALGVLVFIIVLSVIVLIHEGGHYLVAKKSGILCHEFSIGMGPLIYQFKKGETMFSIRAIPFGGYVAMAGEEVEFDVLKDIKRVKVIIKDNIITKIIVNLDNLKYADLPVYKLVSYDLSGTLEALEDELYMELEDESGEINRYIVDRAAMLNAEKKEEIQIAPKNRTFAYKPFWNRFFSVLAGPLMNFVLALIVFFVSGALFGYPNTDSTKVAEVSGSAQMVGIENGDTILEIAGTKLESWNDLTVVLDGVAKGENITADGKVLVKYFDESENAEKTAYVNPLVYVLSVDMVIENPVDNPNNDVIIADIGENFSQSKVGAAGLLPGDKIVKLSNSNNTVDITGIDALLKFFAVTHTDASEITFTVSRKDESGNYKDVDLILKDPFSHDMLDASGYVPTSVTMGVSTSMERDFVKSLYMPWKETGEAALQIFKTLGLFFKKDSGVKLTDLSGPVGILNLFTQLVKGENALQNILYWTGLLSVNIGLVNLFPLPALDGGRLAFLGYEGITRKRPTPKVENTIHNIGFILLMGLFVVVLISDIIKCF